MIGVIVTCLALAGLITYIMHSKGSGGIADIPSDKMMWVKCSNKAYPSRRWSANSASRKVYTRLKNARIRSAG